MRPQTIHIHKEELPENTIFEHWRTPRARAPQDGRGIKEWLRDRENTPDNRLLTIQN